MFHHLSTEKYTKPILKIRLSIESHIICECYNGEKGRKWKKNHIAWTTEAMIKKFS